MSHRLKADAVTLSYQNRIVSTGLSLNIPDGGFTVIIGPNACGKSTLLRSLARLLAPKAGRIMLDDVSISDLPTREVARRVGLLPQAPTAPGGVVVADLVARGRFPYQSLLRQWSPADAAAVKSAMDAAGIADLADRPVSDLSGGQRQRVWIALVLAQETPILLLDEPTTWLDVAHQIDLLDLLARLNRDGKTVVAVLHELNLACRYATHLVAMRDGAIVAQGTPEGIVSEDMIRSVFGLPALVMPDPLTGRPMIIPRAASGC